MFVPVAAIIFGVITILVVCAIAAAYIVRQRHQTESLRAELKLLQTLIQNAPLATVILDSNNNVQLWNSAAEHLFGWTATEVVGHPLPSLSDDVERSRHTLDERLRNEEKLSGIELHRIRRDGGPLDLSMSAALAFDDHRQVIGTIRLFENIKRRKIAEESLRTSEQVFRDLFVEVRRQAQELALLDKVQTALAREVDLPSVFRIVVEAVAEAFGYSLVSAYWLEGDTAVLQHQVGYTTVLTRLPITSGVSGRVVRTGKPILLEDVRSDPDFLGAIEGIVSEVCVPLFEHAKVVGFINIETRNGVVLTEKDLHLMITLSQHVNVAIERAGLYTRLRESESHYRAIVEDQTELICRYSPDRKHTFVNDAYCRFFGQTREELIGTDFLDLPHIAPEDRGRLTRHIEDIAREGKAMNDEHRVKMPDGSIRWLNWTDRPIYDPAGNLIEFQSVGREITDRKQAEQALRESEERYRAVVEDQNEMIARHNMERKITFVNEACCRFLGRDRSALLGQDMVTLPFLGNVDRDRMDIFLREIARAGTPVSAEHQITLPDGEQRWLLWTVRPIYAKDGSTVEFQTIGRDITEHKEAEEIRIRSEKVEREGRAFAEAMRDASAALTSTLDLPTVMMRILENVERVVPHDAAAIDLIEGETARIAYWRNYPPESEAVFKTKGVPVASLPLTQRLRSTQKPYLVTDTHSDPEWVTLPGLEWVRSHLAIPMRVHGTVIGIVNLDSAQPNFFTSEQIERLQVFADQAAVAIDNATLYQQTQQYATELESRVADRTLDLRMANVRLLELDKLKTKFIQDITHEFRTPLSTMNLRLYLLEYDSGEKRENHISVLKKEFARLKDLLESILVFSREQSLGERREFIEHVDLNEIVDEVVSTYQPRAESSRLSLTFSPTLNLPPVEGQVSSLIRVVGNLMINAINYTPVGSICVQTTFVADRNSVCLEVTDTGIGIMDDDKPHLFERFYRGQQVGSMNIPGLGLGLATVREIVNAYGGSIEVESAIGKGSTFRIYLPAVVPVEVKVH